MRPADALTTPISIGLEAAPPLVRLPELQTVFSRRAERCRQLAGAHPLEPYLLFIACLAAAQDAALNSLSLAVPPWPDASADSEAKDMPLLHRVGWQRGDAWIEALQAIIPRLASCDMPEAARAAVDDIARHDRADVLALGQRVLEDAYEAPDAAAAPFILAALQVSWAGAAALMSPEDVERLDPPGLCPMCGSRPVASVVHAAGGLHGARFLHCALCSTQWHFVRIKCPNCASTEGIAYQQIQGGDGAVKAETCDECGTYTKILYLEKDRDLEPFADDLASYALDVLVVEAGWRRAAPNPFLMPIPEGAT
jgi:FdhE protein